MDKRRHDSIKPKRLLPGGTVGIVSPAGRVDPADLHRGAARLEQLGFKVILGKHLEKNYRYFAGKDSNRGEDLLAMFENREVDAILCARGGSGTARTLFYLHPERVQKFPKIVVGCSDITTLLLYLSESFNWTTFHGPMVAAQFGKSPSRALEENFLAVLGGEQVEMRFSGVQSLRRGDAEGIITGGCLTLICTTIGTPYEIDTEGKIFFIEDVDEAPYRIDRMLTYLKTVKKFEKVRGVVFGQMPRCQPEVLPELILEILSGYDFPVLFGFPSGHGDATATLPFGVRVHLDGSACSLKMLESAVNHT